ncbi:MAG TPA: inner membrane CreD family protein [Polyangiaceae bacterium]|nr:inner membrane CreD family protein [Polyangiaceae bacterium]
MKRFLAIAVIWVGCTIAWLILGGTLNLRTDSHSGNLGSEVNALWGPPGQQAPPLAKYQKTVLTEEVTVEQKPEGNSKKIVQRETKVDVPLALDSSNVHAKLTLEQKRKGLLWFPTYGIDFRAEYTFSNDLLGPHDVTVHFPLQTSGSTEDGSMRGSPTNSASFDGFTVQDGQGQAVDYRIVAGEAVFSRHFHAGERQQFRIAYRTRGTSSFRYLMAQGTGRVHDLTVRIETNFANVNFPSDTLSPTSRALSPNGFSGTWHFDSLISTSAIGIELPQLLNPGPLATKVTFFAPVSLLFFFFVVAVLGQVRGHELHPMHYFLLSCAFFAFHLLFAYLVDRLSIGASFAIASGVSVFLVVSYARLFVGWTFALREIGIAQLLYLVLFSYTFFWEGFTGLAITIGAIATLFFVMQTTGRSDWRLTGQTRQAVPAE